MEILSSSKNFMRSRKKFKDGGRNAYEFSLSIFAREMGLDRAEVERNTSRGREIRDMLVREGFRPERDPETGKPRRRYGRADAVAPEDADNAVQTKTVWWKYHPQEASDDYKQAEREGMETD